MDRNGELKGRVGASCEREEEDVTRGKDRERKRRILCKDRKE